jgi:4-carboxymuconolactone decarboxylase
MPLSPRISPLPEEERVGQARELLDAVSVPGAEDANIFTTLVQAPGLFRKWLPFGGKLNNGKLPPRDRELLILRTGWNCRAEYEWAQHSRLALSYDLTAEEIDRVTLGAEAPGWGEFDATLLRAADELHSDYCVSDDTWSSLAARYDTEQLIEVPMLVGHFHLVGMTLNCLGVQLDQGLHGFPA